VIAMEELEDEDGEGARSGEVIDLMQVLRESLGASVAAAEKGTKAKGEGARSSAPKRTAAKSSAATPAAKKPAATRTARKKAHARAAT
jgi:hypothetical protein